MATRNVACAIVDRAKGASLTVGKNPMSVAAAAVPVYIEDRVAFARSVLN